MAFNWYLESSCMYVIDEDLIQLIESYHVHLHSHLHSHELNMSKKLISKDKYSKSYKSCVGSMVRGALKYVPGWASVRSSILSCDHIFLVFILVTAFTLIFQSPHS